ncbi:hypothetical protein ZRA01_25250 [Zoogloea ramigera]|jgi:acetyltransferase-like isoleucine patch superfamily enzyme|uniref:Uncharacterized protein n=1 Tax=Zoogloea ramigera TaxID=350 RepID=A0A4Y4CWF3_ZOORA|nr:DapH/DapD/GlmU-related protein [Zoogloea ramigera]GEC96452.1 hypothetical protein ZRA01_25250 [Zoogloea ramigera]
MKTTYLDFLLCGLVIALISAGAVGLVWGGYPWSKAVFADYHVVADFFLALLAYGLLSALVVRLILRLRPILPGEYNGDSPVFTVWKLVTIVYRLGQGALLPFTTVFTRPVVEALFGARVGANVAIGGTIDDPYQVSIGDGAVVGHNSLISGNVLYGGRLTIGRVSIGAGATVGVNSVVLPGVEIGENAVLMGGSHVMPGTRVPAGETWRGNPARKWL